MRKFLLSLFCLGSFSLCSASIYESNLGYIFSFQPIAYDDFDLNLSTPEWQPRSYYYGILPSSIGYFHVNNWDGNIAIFGSNRYIQEDDLEAFYCSLQPFETVLLPYATPSSNNYLDCHVLSEEEAVISNIPAKKVVFEVRFPNGKDEIVISYIFCKARNGLFSDYVLGYTYSVSCYKSEYEMRKESLDKIIQKLRIR